MDISDFVTWQVMKWVLLILVAGFIGQFGKSFAQYVMHRAGRKKAGTPAPGSTPAQDEILPGRIRTSAVQPDGVPSSKKETKALLKARKKEAKRKGT